jgi:hypothetical protein
MDNILYLLLTSTKSASYTMLNIIIDLITFFVMISRHTFISDNFPKNFSAAHFTNTNTMSVSSSCVMTSTRDCKIPALSRNIHPAWLWFIFNNK